jgi:hypothetical protein
MALIENIELDEKFSFSSKAKSKIITLIVVGAVLAILGFFFLQLSDGHDHGHGAEHHATEHVAAADHDHGHHGKPVWAKRFIKNLWQNNIYFGGIALIGIFFLAFNYVAYAGWSALIKRIPEAMGYYLPIFAIFTLILMAFFGHDIFHWQDPSLFDPNSPHYDAIVDSKKWWLDTTSLWVRSIIYFALWIAFWYVLRQKSLKEDLEGGLIHYDRSIVWAAGFLVIFGVTSSTSAWDWVMSMDPHFFSTMFGWYVFASWLVAGVSMITVIVITLKENGYLKFVNENHLHDLGKFMFAFSVFWTYIWFEQFLLIYYSNIPEEVVYFVERLYNPAYQPFFFFTLIVNFAIPFILLMTRNAKRQMIIVKIVGIIIIFGHWLDFYMMMTPPMLHNDGGFDYIFFFVELGLAMIFLGIFLYAVLFGLSKAGLIAKNHPMIQESIHHDVF